VPHENAFPWPPINNVHIYVVDEHLSRCLSARRERSSSPASALARLHHDSERTRQAFMVDPHRSGPTTVPQR